MYPLTLLLRLRRDEQEQHLHNYVQIPSHLGPGLPRGEDDVMPRTAPIHQGP